MRIATLLRWAPAVLIVVLAGGLLASGALQHLSLRELQAHHQALRAYVDAHPALSLGLFLAANIAIVLACLPGPGLMCVIGGYLFGLWLGGAVALIGAVTGSVLVFAACRGALGEALARSGGPRAAALAKTLQDHAFSTLLTLRLVPVMPLMALNIGAGAARAPAGAFAAASLLGGAPVTFILAALGSGLGAVFARGERVDASLLTAPRIVAPLMALALLSAGGAGWRLIRARRARLQT